MDFVHLHNHTEYSLADSIARITDYIDAAKKNGMTALAITDLDSMGGVLEFFSKCREAGIKPIIGRETSIENMGQRREELRTRIVLLAMNKTGYRNLLYLNYASRKADYDDPVVSYLDLENHSEGLICLSGYLEGELARDLLACDYLKAKTLTLQFRKIFGDRYYIEMQDHGTEEDRILLPRLCVLADNLGIKTVCTNDIHYIGKKDADVLDTLACIEQYRLKRRTVNGENYFKSQEEMEALFAWRPEAIKATFEIAERCNLDISTSDIGLPDFMIPSGFPSADEYLMYLANEGLKERYSDITPMIRQRMDHELSVIKDTGSALFFIIIWDCIRFARSKDMRIWPGRGRAAGSIVCYALMITDIDPMEYGLVFESFINPLQSPRLPYLEICCEDKNRLIGYVAERYGSDCVAMVLADYERYESAEVLQAVGCAFGLVENRVLYMKHFLEYVPKGDIDLALETIPGFREEIESLSCKEEFLYNIRMITGLIKSVSPCQSRIVIADKPIYTEIPVSDMRGCQLPVVQHRDIEMAGYDLCRLCVSDSVALRILKQTERLIRKKEPGFDITRIGYHDDRAFALLCSGSENWLGWLHCIEEHDIDLVSALDAIQPRCLMDIAAAFCSDPEEFIEAKDTYDDSVTAFPELRGVLAETYGVLMYQEQMIMISKIIAGYSPEEGDILRREIGKRRKSTLDHEHGRFREAAIRNGYTETEAETIYHILWYSNGAPCKSHVLPYAVIAYQMAYLKAHYSEQFDAVVSRFSEEL